MADDYEDKLPRIESENFRAFAERLAEALRPLWQHDLVNMEQRLAVTRKADIESGLLEALGVDASQKQDYKEMNQASIRRRRRGIVVRGKIVDLADDSLWKLIKMFVSATVIGGAVAFGSHYLPAWILAMVTKG